ncbi:ALOX5 [Bugula neritina]|uniref:ALOX5 n=1 Tax=Bugula neritina TaxID=10212 RepID=A0A7J7JVE0_BUGNE|nr:ALOX5 [Bugula neritina]
MGADLSKDKPTHEVFVYTGDKKGGSVRNITVFLTLTDISGEVSKEQKLTKWYDNDFDKWNREEINLMLPGFTKITDIAIRRGDESENDDWYIERVVVEHRNDEGGVQHSSIFPLNRWLHAGDRMSFVEFDSCLPQFDKYSVQRKQELQEIREEYVLVQKIDGAPHQVDVVPRNEEFTTRYFIDVSGSLAVSGVKTTVTGVFTQDFNSLLDIESLYEGKFTIPEGVNRWRSDEEFGNQKLAGCNPIIIKKCHSVPTQ